MTTDDKDWLSLREAIDRRSRDANLAEEFARRIAVNTTIVDLACGTGSNIRYLQPLVALDHNWMGIDNDSESLLVAKDRISGVDCSAAELRFRCCNLADGCDQIPQDLVSAVTASAFLDITSDSWVDGFVGCFGELPLLVAMTPVGLPEFEPFDYEDDAIRHQLALHQCSDQGFGPALGCGAIDYLSSALRNAGRTVTVSPSDWELSDGDASILRMLIAGIARRTRSLSDAIDTERWESVRHEQLRSKALRLTIRHRDLLSVPS